MDQFGLLCCSLDEIDSRIEQVQSMIAGGPSGKICALTTCNIGARSATIEDRTSQCTKDPCVKDCILYHESIHVKQCKEGVWPPYVMKSELDQEAYQAELYCLIGMKKLTR
jgi:hypothetical protein